MLIEGLYTVNQFSYEDGNVSAIVFLNKDHDIFKGHFPGNPVMPGVCTMQIIKELTEQAVDKALFLSVSSNIKFMALINPEKNPELSLQIQITEDSGIVKIKNVTSFEDTVALKLNAQYTIV